MNNYYNEMADNYKNGKNDQITEWASLVGCMLALLFGAIAFQMPNCIPTESVWYPANIIVFSIVTAIICYEMEIYADTLTMEMEGVYCFDHNLPISPDNPIHYGRFVSGIIRNEIMIALTVALPLAISKGKISIFTILIPAGIFLEHLLSWICAYLQYKTD